MKYLFKRIDINLVVIDAESLDDAQLIADELSPFDPSIESAEGQWECAEAFTTINEGA